MLSTSWYRFAAALAAASIGVALSIVGNPVAGIGTTQGIAAIDEDPEGRAYLEWLQFRNPRTGVIPRFAHRDEQRFAQLLPVRNSHALLKGSSVPGYEWTSRGPVNIGGRTRALAFDRSNSNIVLAGGVTGGMWRSTDRGVSWRRTTTKEQLPSVTCIAQDPRPGYRQYWYYGTGEGRTNSTRFGNVGQIGDGMFRSADSGKTWTQLPSTVTNTPQSLDGRFDLVWNLAIDPTSNGPGTIYAAASGAVMRSTDAGLTWQTALGGPGETPGYTCVTMTSRGVVYASVSSGADRGIWRSANGIEWVNISPSAWPDSLRSVVIAIAPSNENILYVACESPGSGTIVPGSYGFDEYYSLWKYRYRSGDGSAAGGTWEDRSDNLPQFGGPWNFNGLNSYALTLDVKPTDTNVVYLGGTNLYRSDTGFASSDRLYWLGGYAQDGGYGGDADLHPDQHALLFDPDTVGLIWSASDGGIARARDQDSGALRWTSLNHGYVTTQFYTVALDHDSAGSPVLLGGLQDNGSPLTLSADPSAPWYSLFGGDGSFCAVADHGRTFYVSYQYGGTYRIRLDSTGQVLDYTRVDPRGATGYLFVAPFALDPVDRRIMYFPAGPDIWRNSNLDDIPGDGGGKPTINWKSLYGVPSTMTISAVGVSTRNPAHRLYYGTTDGHVFVLDDANKPTPPSEREITGAEFPTGGYINSIAVDPDNADNALVVFTNYEVQSLFYTDDGGVTWQAVGGNLEESADGSGAGPSCRWATIGHHSGNRYIFVGTTVGLFSTTIIDGANTRWEIEGDTSIGNVRVDMIDMRESDGVVAVATWGNGIYTTSLPTSEVTAGESSELEVSVSPNPASTALTLSYNLPLPSAITFLLCDEVGRIAYSGVEQLAETGLHRINLDVNALPAGRYFYRLAWRGGSSSGSIIIAR